MYFDILNNYLFIFFCCIEFIIVIFSFWVNRYLFVKKKGSKVNVGKYVYLYLNILWGNECIIII